MNMKLIDKSLLDSLVTKAKDAPRKRAHFNLHPELSDPVQRLCIAIEPETYVRPHRHAEPATCEVFLLLRGSAKLLFFDDQGQVTEQVILAASGPNFAVEIPPRTWHSIVSLESGTVFFEVKQGPYVQPQGQHTALWAPEEGTALSARFLEWFRNAKAGDRLSV
jgi:cupin fold WbuC family metalloprotein